MRAGNFITHVQSLLGDPEGEFHTTEKVLLHLNTAIEEVCTRSRTICTWIYLPAIKGQGMYGMPDDFLAFKYVGFYYQDQLLEIHPGGIADAAPAIFSQRNYYNIPHTFAEGGNAYVEKVVTTVQRLIETQEVYPGVGTGAFIANAEIPTVLVGDRLINYTDGSEGVVTAVDNPNGRISYADLANGQDNTMSQGDHFRILSRTEHRHTLSIAPPPQKTDKVGAESIFVFYAREHLPITKEHIDNRNDEIEIGTEWNAALRHRVCYYGSLEEKGIDNHQTQLFEVAYETEYMKRYPKANRRIQQTITTWRRGGKRPPPRITIKQTGDYAVRNPAVE